MFTLLVSSWLGIRTGIEGLFVKETAPAVNTLIPGRPSSMTMFAFCLVATSGVFVMLKPKKLRKMLTVLGAMLAVIGTVGILGYLLNVPALYYSIKGFSSAIACHTAILFVLLGIGLCASTRN
jgi:mannose/fructose/N-acetylgalactosamine-specific phosphotransferase system component IIC